MCVHAKNNIGESETKFCTDFAILPLRSEALVASSTKEKLVSELVELFGRAEPPPLSISCTCTCIQDNSPLDY